MSLSETNCAIDTGFFPSTINRKNKNFREDDETKQISWNRVSISNTSEFSEFSDKKSEISEGRRIDIDSDLESQHNYHTKSKI
jgi:hypothetical protein